jgi:hypothetical protein
VKRPRRLTVLAALYGTGALAGWVGAEFAGLGSLGIESTTGAPIEVSRAISATARAEHVNAPRATALGEHGVSVADIASGSAAFVHPSSDAAARGGTSSNRVVEHARSGSWLPYGERQRRFVRPSSDATASHATRAVRGGESD